MQFFYALFNVEDTLAVLDENESSHAIHVLRKKVGDTIYVCNGKGLLYEASIQVAHAKATQVHLIRLLEQKNAAHPYYLHIAIAPTKNMDRLENFIEKACELGIDEITPIICERSERKEVKIERLYKIALSAMKQSQALFLPQLNEAIPFKKFIENKESLYVCTCYGERELINTVKNIQNTYTFLIGPEGDFTHAEIQLAQSVANTKLIDLGPKRLRTETAGIYVASCIYTNHL